MSKRILSVGFAVGLFWSTVIVVAQEQAAQPVFKDGDSWQFTINQKGLVVSTTERITGTYELVFSQGKVKVYEMIGDQKSELDIKPGAPGDGLYALIGQHELRPTLKFPLSAGQKWTYEYETRPPSAARESKEICRGCSYRHGTGSNARRLF